MTEREKKMIEAYIPSPRVCCRRKRENMDDSIFRRDVLDAIDKYILGKEEDETCEVRELLRLITKIYHMPSAQPRWIPMKERRPEKDGRYLCTFQGKDVHICMYLNGCFRIYGYNEDNLITAWMPLPEPYREEETHENR